MFDVLLLKHEPYEDADKESIASCGDILNNVLEGLSESVTPNFSTANGMVSHMQSIKNEPEVSTPDPSILSDIDTTPGPC